MGLFSGLRTGSDSTGGQAHLVLTFPVDRLAEHADWNGLSATRVVKVRIRATYGAELNF